MLNESCKQKLLINIQRENITSKEIKKILQVHLLLLLLKRHLETLVQKLNFL
jgi:transposase